MKKYEVTVLPAKVARELKALCDSEAQSLHNTAAFKPRTTEALEHTAKTLLMQAKACIIGLIPSRDLYIDLPEHFLTEPVNTIVLPSKHSFTRTIALVPPYTVPTFMYKNQLTPADEIPHILSYKCLNQGESFDMYKRVTFEKGITV